jgi:hypothetical protein
VEPSYLKKQRDHAAGKKHSNHQESHENLLAEKIPPGERVRAEHAKENAYEGSRYGIQNGVHVGPFYFRVLKDDFIDAQIDTYRKKGNMSGGHGKLVAE